MIQTTDGFVISAGVLTEYAGPGGDIAIPDGVTAIGRAAFLHCTGLTRAVLPDGVTEIGLSAFESCVGLRRASPRSAGMPSGAVPA